MTTIAIDRDTQGTETCGDCAGGDMDKQGYSMSPAEADDFARLVVESLNARETSR